jgi:uncharacterized protein (DUF305 family)
MTHFTTRRTFAAAIVAGMTVPVARAATAQDTSTPADHEAHHAGTPTATVSAGMDMMGTPGAGSMMPMGDVDLMFIDMMTPHHEGAIAMSEVALERAEHPELAELAQRIIDSQRAEIDQLAAWRDEWYPDAPVMSMDDMMGGMGNMMQGMPGMQQAGGMGMGMMDMMGMMDPELAAEQMRAAPEPFDLAFINAMLPHHISALMMAEMMVQNAVHPELAELSQQMVDEQAGEISQMNTWRAEWYGATGAATPAS